MHFFKLVLPKWKRPTFRTIIRIVMTVDLLIGLGESLKTVRQIRRMLTRRLQAYVQGANARGMHSTTFYQLTPRRGQTPYFFTVSTKKASSLL